MENEPYNEDFVLTRYVPHHFSNLLSDEDRLVLHAIRGRQKADASPNPQMAAKIRIGFGKTGNSSINARIGDDPDTCQRQIRDQLLKNYHDQILINRCPNCTKIVRTPRAKQCFWCGHDWH